MNYTLPIFPLAVLIDVLPNPTIMDRILLVEVIVENVFISTHPLVAHKLSILRSKETEPKKFRALVKEIAGLLAYEATIDLVTSTIKIETPLQKLMGRN